MRFKGFIGPAYTLDSINFDAQQCVNMFPIVDEIGTGRETEVAYLQGTPGLSKLVDTPFTVNSMYVSSTGVLFFTTSIALYRLYQGTVTTVGDIVGDTPLYSMKDNGTQLLLVTGLNGYVVDLTTYTFTAVTSGGFSGGRYVVFFDNYMILNIPNSNVLYLSSLGDASTYDVLDRFSVDGTPDPILRHINLHRELWIFKRTTIEVFYNTGNLNTPFQREAGVFIEKGCVSGDTVVKINNTIMWVGAGLDGSGIVYIANGYEPQRVSTFHVERLLSAETPNNLTAWSYEYDGHVFYNITTSTTTLSMDLTTNMWHERRSINTDTGDYLPYEGTVSTPYNNLILVASSTRSLIFYLDKFAYDDYGRHIVRLRSSPYISSGLKRVLHRFIQLDIETGAVGQSATPCEIIIETSDDNCRSWISRRIGLGGVGEYRHRTRVNKLGSSRGRVYRVKFSDKYPFRLLGAELDVVGAKT